jgi:group II intron reverse transcriptase/maturase
MLERELSRISQISSTGRRVENLAHLLNTDLLRQCFKELDPNKASGIDKVTKRDYAQHLERNLEQLVAKLRGGIYSPQPSRRVYIPKPGTDKMRPLGISCFEDKIVERAIAKILNAVYEPKFLDCSYGFRPKRNCHLAVSVLLKSIHQKTSYVVEADIRSCFDTIDHNWLLTFLEHDIADRRFIEIIRRGIKAGHFEDGMFHLHEAGTMQGSGYSPVLCNVFLHYVLDTWFRFLKESPMAPYSMRFRGDVQLVRYADDFVATFQYKDDAERFYRLLKQRFTKYGFALAGEKTRIIRFGRFAARDAETDSLMGRSERRKPDTFDFLGFTFYCSLNKKGRFCCKLKSAAKRVRTKLKKISEWLKANRSMGLEEYIKHICRVLNGYFNYYCVTCNEFCTSAFRFNVIKLMFKWLNRRSQRKSYTWEEFLMVIEKYKVPKAYFRVDIYHYHDEWLLEEPCARIGHARNL